MTTEQNAQMTLDQKIDYIFNEIKKINEVKRSMKANKKLLEDSMQNLEQKIDKEFKDINRKIKDLESDNRTDKALIRAAQQMGFGFHEKTPYELQGNAAIEDIKEYY